VKIPLTALADRPVEMDSVEEAATLDLVADGVEFLDDVDVLVTLTRMGEDVLAQGTAVTRVRQNCSRCLEPVDTEIAGDFQSLYVPTTGSYGKRMDRKDFEWSDQRVIFYTSDTIDLSDDIRNCLLFELPKKPLCRKDCAGLCPGCGANLNETTCTCEVPAEDDPWAALRAIVQPPDPPE